MIETAASDSVHLLLTGKQLALLSGASVLLYCWPFQRAEARTVAQAISFEDGESLSEVVFASLRTHFSAAGLWPGDSPWTQTLIDRRAAISGLLSLSKQQARAAMAALESCGAEFETSWWEFEVVAPGVGMYGATPADLSSLAELIRSADTAATSRNLGEVRVAPVFRERDGSDPVR